MHDWQDKQNQHHQNQEQSRQLQTPIILKDDCKKTDETFFINKLMRLDYEKSYLGLFEKKLYFLIGF